MGLSRSKCTPLGCILLVALCRQCSAWQYGLIIDAGSGGSRLHVFRWPERVADPLHPQNPAISIPEEVLQVSEGVGISAFANNVSGLGPYLDKLLGQAQEQMQPLREHWSIIPIYLKATAGARDLFQDERDAIFLAIRQYLYECPFRFETDYWARTISGEEEGVYAWLTVNTITGTFRSTRKEDTWGSMDMGGASTQVAFIPHDVSIIQNFYPLHLSYMSLHLYAHSYLEFGYSAANQRLLRQLLAKSDAVAQGRPLEHPCYPAGVQFRQPLQGPFFVGQQPIMVAGTGKYKQCLELARGLLDLDKPCFVPGRSRDFANDSSASGACAIAGTYEPALYSQKFVAMGQYAKIARSMGLPLSVKVPLSDWYEGMERLCKAAPDTLEFDTEVDNPEALADLPVPGGWISDPMGSELSRCWKAIWFWTVMHKGFRFPVDKRQIMFAHQLHGKATGWALGSMAYDVNYYPWGELWEPGTEEGIFRMNAELPAHPARPAYWGGLLLGAVGLGAACGLLVGIPLGMFGHQWFSAAGTAGGGQPGCFIRLLCSRWVSRRRSVANAEAQYLLIAA